AVEVVALAAVQTLRQAHAAERARLEADADARELAAQEAVVEARVVRDEEPPGEPLVQLLGKLGETRRARDELAGDAGERLDLRRDGGAGIDERRPLRDQAEVLDLEHRDLGDAIDAGPSAGGLEV